MRHTGKNKKLGIEKVGIRNRYIPTKKKYLKISVNIILQNMNRIRKHCDQKRKNL
jgi:hypothetical protein